MYVRVPKELNEYRRIVWQVLKMPNGITEAGRQWAVVIEEWIINKARFETVRGISQLFLKNHHGRIEILIAKVTADILMAGSVTCMKKIA